MFYIFVFFFSLFSHSEVFDGYDRDVEVPEPLFVDLVRGLHSEKGEWEINSLFSHNEGTYSDLRWAPEIEWAIADGTAIEFELPMIGSQLKAYKFAFQKRLHRSEDRHSLHGVQLLYESERRFDHSDFTFFYILAHRFDFYWSLITISGMRTVLEKYHGVDASLNTTVFYNYSREVDLGLEVNYASDIISERFVQIMPQLHLALRTGWKVQFGFGTREEEHKWSPTSALRIIKEFNK